MAVKKAKAEADSGNLVSQDRILRINAHGSFWRLPGVRGSLFQNPFSGQAGSSS